MTIAISLKVNDGVVLATDSASTLIQRFPDGNTRVINVYQNANKVFNLYKGLPIGAITWGVGSIGNASISTLVKDFRKLLLESDMYQINPNSYTIEEVANKFKQYIFEEKYKNDFSHWPIEQQPTLGFMIVGYSSGADSAEEYLLQIMNGDCPPPSLVRGHEEAGLTWNGEPEPITRLYIGFSPQIIGILRNFLNEPQIEDFINLAKSQIAIPFVTPAMPIQDAIDLAEFLVDTTINYSKFGPGAPTVGGPIEIAAITKHEGYKWIKRKYYFNNEINNS